MKAWLLVGPILLACCSPVSNAGERFSLAVTGSCTTDTRFLYNIDQPTESINDRYFSYNFGFGLNARWLAYRDDILIGINVEKIRSVEQSLETLIDRGFQYLVPVEEGFVVYPVEVTGYFVIPFSTDDVRAYLGGGIGWYFGERIYSLGQASTVTVNSPMGFGIHVLTGADFRVSPSVSIRGELKFRDPQFDSVNSFDAATTTYAGVRILLPQTPAKTRVNLIGITYGLGLVFHL